MSCVTDVLLGSMAFWTASAARTYSPRAWVIVSRLLFCEQQAPMVFGWSSKEGGGRCAARRVGCASCFRERCGEIRRRPPAAAAPLPPPLSRRSRFREGFPWTREGQARNLTFEPVAPGLARATRGRRRFYPGQSRRGGTRSRAVAIVDCDCSDVNKAARIAATRRASARHPLQELLALLRIAPRRKTAAKQPWASA